MASNPPQGFQNKNRAAILAELDKEKRRLIQSQSLNSPGASIALSRPAVNKDFRDHAEQQHIAAQQKAALQLFASPSMPTHTLQASSSPRILPSGTSSFRCCHDWIQNKSRRQSFIFLYFPFF
ncbi:SOSS complex subunit C isoform X1 [Denticeps clupeoides]|uniref:SOSS complex subunit C isoform X1 n=1 Tax=Denticeps clupeoides TaxID=299321 RepID=UPI0010A58C0D|nr:SOSS complex subunit C isoform X1 [Denticeps clupeoides]XP_028828424.1 SOSS complex subunit C isoform X1 [Denticeps clupeoides]